MPTVPDIHRRGTRAAQGSATNLTIGTLYFVTDEGVTERWTGTAWESYSGGGAGGGPHAATHVQGGSDVLPVSAGARLLGRGEGAAGPMQELQLGEYLTLTGTMLDVAGAGETPFIVQSLDVVRGRPRVPPDYLPYAQPLDVLPTGYMKSTTGTGVVTTTPTIPAADLPPVLDLTEQGAVTAPAANVARVAALDDQGFTQVEWRDSGNRVLRLTRDNADIMQAAEAVGAGQVVYIAGAAGANVRVALARADNLATLPAIGFTLDAAPLNGFLRVLLAGHLRGLDTSAFVEGARVYVSSTVAGAITATLPVPPHRAQRVGIVTRSHATLGEVLVQMAPALLEDLAGSGGGVAPHEATHRNGGADALRIDHLAGYPGATDVFLRGDGNFVVVPVPSAVATEQVQSATGTVTVALTARATWLRCTGSAPLVINGFTPAVGHGDELVIDNCGTSYVRVLHNQGASADSWRVLTGAAAGQFLGVGGRAVATYDNTVARWRLSCVNPGAAIDVPYNASDYSGFSMPSTKLKTYNFRQHGDQLTVNFYADDVSVIAGGTQYLGVVLPFGMTSKRNLRSAISLRNNAAWSTGHVFTGAPASSYAANYIYLAIATLGQWAAGAGVDASFSITLTLE